MSLKYFVNIRENFVIICKFLRIVSTPQTVELVRNIFRMETLTTITFFIPSLNTDPPFYWLPTKRV
jgi:hypothetical protein